MVPPWISEERLIEICRETIKNGTPKTRGLNYDNVVDPFSAIFDIATNEGMTLPEWKEHEIIRQHQKTLQNWIGWFHQSVLGSLDGWEDLKIGKIVDIQNKDKKYVAEVKNKYNSLTGTNKKHLYDRLARWLDSPGHEGYIAFYVQVLTQGRFKQMYAPTENDQVSPKRPDIIEIDGHTFYDMMTGDTGALEKLYACLPDVLEKASNGTFKAASVIQDPLYKELIQKLPK